MIPLFQRLRTTPVPLKTPIQHSQGFSGSWKGLQKSLPSLFPASFSFLSPSGNFIFHPSPLLSTGKSFLSFLLSLAAPECLIFPGLEAWSCSSTPGSGEEHRYREAGMKKTGISQLGEVWFGFFQLQEAPENQSLEKSVGSVPPKGVWDGSEDVPGSAVSEELRSSSQEEAQGRGREKILPFAADESPKFPR